MYLYSLENHVTNSVQIAEDSILSACGKEKSLTLSVECKNILKRKEMDRFHIIIASRDTALLTDIEKQQLNYITTQYLYRIQDAFDLDADNVPQSGELKNLQVGTPKKVLIQDFVIYEAVYKDENSPRTHTTDNISYFIKYTVKITENKYVSAEKEIVQKNNAKINGNALEGSTVDSSLRFTINASKMFDYQSNEVTEGIPVNVRTQMDIVSKKSDSRTKN